MKSIKDRIKQWKRKRTLNKYYKSEIEDTRKKISAGPYHVDIVQCETKKGCWNLSKGRVYNTETKKLITEVRSNYHHMPYVFVLDHPDSHDYLITGEDYQGQTLIQLDTGERVDYLPKEATKGFGFCWASIEPSPYNKNIIAVDGCYWACPYETIIYDFSYPMELPYKELARGDSFIKWTPLGCEVGQEEEVRASDGKKVDDMTDDELDKADKDNDWKIVNHVTDLLYSP